MGVRTLPWWMKWALQSQRRDRPGAGDYVAQAATGPAGNRMKERRMSFDDPAAVRRQYADEANLRARQALWAETEGENPRDLLWRVLAARRPKRVLEAGGGQGELAE